jgi:hypothetical protein
MLSQKATDQKFSVSKWLKHQVLLDDAEMEACLEALGPFEFYNVSSLAAFEELHMTRKKFLKSYRDYITALKSGGVPVLDRPAFSAVMTVEAKALYAQEIRPGKWMAKLAQPVLQLQNHRFFASKVDHKIHSMVMSPDSIQWGLQFAYPQIFFDGSGSSYQKTSDEEQFPNAALFAKFVKWVRENSVPTTFVWDGHRVATPLRLGKACFQWIENHPQLQEQGVKVHVF